MGRWLGMAAVSIPLAVALLAVAFGFEGFLRNPGREGLATPKAAVQIQRPKPPKIEKTPVEGVVEAKVLELGTIDQGTVASAEDGVKLKSIKVEPLYRDVVTTKEQGLSVVFAIDNSLSMIDGPWGRGNDPTYLRLEATREALRQLKDSGRAAVVTFPRPRALQERYSFNVPMAAVFQRFASPRVAEERVENLRYREDGGTPLYIGAELALNVLAAEPKDRAKVMVLLTDGRQEPPMIVPSSLLEAKEESGAKVYGVTLGSNTDLTQMASFTDEVRQVQDASDLVKVFRTLIEKSVRQRSGYLVKAVVERVGEPFASGEKVRLRAWIGGRPRIVEAVAQ